MTPGIVLLYGPRGGAVSYERGTPVGSVRGGEVEALGAFSQGVPPAHALRERERGERERERARESEREFRPSTNTGLCWVYVIKDRG